MAKCIHNTGLKRVAVDSDTLRQLSQSCWSTDDNDITVTWLSLLPVLN